MRIRFREIQEVKKSEKLRKQKEKEELGYLQIKPEKKMTMDEMEQAFKEIFDEACRKANEEMSES